MDDRIIKNYVRYSRRIKLDDGYQISIIHKTGISYGDLEGLFECATMTPENLCLDDSVTGHLDFHEVAEYIKKAKEQHNNG